MLIAMYCLSKYKEKRSRDDIYMKNKIGRVPQKLGEPKIKEPPLKLKNDAEKGSNSVLTLFRHLSFPLTFSIFNFFGSSECCF